MAEGARLESVYTATYRGFEPLSHHHLKRESPNSRSGFFLCLFPGRNYLLMHSQRRLNGIKQIRLVSQPHHIRRMWTVRSNTQLATGMPL